MAHITLAGTLLDPDSSLAVGDKVRFTHTSTTGQTVSGNVSVLTIDEFGAYSIDLQYGLVLVEYKDVNRSIYKTQGVATVNQDNPATSIPELLNALVPVSSAELIEFQAILANCVTAETNSAQSAVEAAQSAVDAAGSAFSIVDSVHGFPDLNSAISSATVEKIHDGAALNVKESSTGNGGGSMWDVVLASSVTVDGKSIIASTGIPSLALVLRLTPSVSVFSFKTDSNTMDDTLVDAIDYCDVNRVQLHLGNANINLVNDVVFPNTLDVFQDSRGALIGNGTNSVIINNSSNNGKKKVFGTIDSMDRCLVVRGSTNNIEFHSLSNSRQCLVMESLSSSSSDRSLDNVIKGVQIGGCDDAIVFQQYADNTIQQGNQIEVNFISGCKDAVVFDDNAQHTQQGDWDSNNVQLQAIDNQRDNASFLINRSSFPVNNQTIESYSWNGGLLAPNSNLVKGKFRGCKLRFITANPTSVDDVCIEADASTLSTGSLVIKRGGSKIHPNSGEVIDAIETQLSADFRGGSQLQNNSFLINHTLTTLINPGATERVFIFHALAFSPDYQPFSISPYNTTTLENIDSMAIAGVGNTGDRGMISLWMHNKTGAAIPVGTNFKWVVSQNYAG